MTGGGICGSSELLEGMSDPDKKERSGDLGAYVPSSVDMVPTINSWFPPPAIGRDALI